MPFELTWEPRGVYRRYHGDVTIAERLLSLEAICGDPRFDTLRYSITDYRDAVTYEITPQSTEETAAMHIAPLVTNPHIAIAAVATNPQIIGAIQHFIALDFIAQPYRVFTDLPAARDWIARLKATDIPMRAPTVNPAEFHRP